MEVAITIGEAARKRLVELAKEEGVNPHELVINCGDVCLLHEIGKICGRRGSDHPSKFLKRMMNGIRKSRLFELRGYLSLPERGRGRIACYGLKRGVGGTKGAAAEVEKGKKKEDCKFYDERRSICILNDLPCVLDEEKDCKNYEKEEWWAA